MQTTMELNGRTTPIGITSPAGQSVKIIAMSQPLNLELMPDAEAIIGYCSRVSNPSNQMNHETADKLLRYLVKHQHWSPLEMASVTIEIVTTRDIARQILRHRSFSFQEFSQRYADPTDMKPIFREARLQDTKNRQNSVEVDDSKLQAAFRDVQQAHWDTSIKCYKEALDAGIAKEQARCYLPEGLTPSVMYMQGTLRSWLHFVDLRSGNGTQKEHQWLAKNIGLLLTQHFPNIMGLTGESK